MVIKPAYEIVKTTMGAVSILDTARGEIMHNPVGPWREAHDLYVAQSNLKEKLLDQTRISEPVVIFDVGLGAGFNAMAAISEYFRCRERGRARPLTIVSFENKMDLFAFSRDHIDQFKGYDGFQILMGNLWDKREIHSDSGLTWLVREGDFDQTIGQEKKVPEIIFYDPYSPKVNPEMWTYQCFKKLYDNVAGKQIHSIMVTYSVATGIRTAMLLAGFYVGIGQNTGLKAETTFASTALSQLLQPLGKSWLERWDRSHTPLPPLCPFTREEARERLKNHPQFT